MSRTVPIRVAIALALALPALGVTAASALTASAVASQTSGVAPLAVFFDARGSSDTGVSSDAMYLGASYSWDFGDTACKAGGDLWPYSGQSKCTDMGPVAAHVYETPGTYTVTLKVFRGSSTATKQLSITVGNPATFYSGGTTCVSTSGSFSGCPTGAAHVTSSAAWASILSSYGGTNKRILFNRGDTWSVTGPYSWSAANMTVGAYGTGAKPAFQLARGDITAVDCAGGNSGIRLMDLAFTGDNVATDGQQVAYCTYHSAPLRNMLLLRVATLYMSQSVQFDSKGMSPGTSYMNHGLFIVDSTLEHKTGGSAHNNLLGGSEDIAVMGNQIGPDDGDEHVLRFYHADGMVLAHNKVMPTPNSQKHLVKLHSDSQLPGAPCSTAVEIADNLFYPGPSHTAVSIGPEDSSHPTECVRLVRVERNYFETGTAGNYEAIHLYTGPNLVDANLFNVNSTSLPGGDLVKISSDRPSNNTPPNGNLIYNNTCAKINDGNYGLCIQLNDSGVTNTVVRNNLAYYTQSGGSSSVVQDYGKGTVQSNNLLATADPFVAAGQPTNASGMQCKPGSAPIDAGSNLVPLPWADFSGAPGSRLQGANVDIGAWELSSTAASAGGPPSAPVLLP